MKWEYQVLRMHSWQEKKGGPHTRVWTSSETDIDLQIDDMTNMPVGEALNMAGQQGWELIYVIPHYSEEIEQYSETFYFKQPARPEVTEDDQ